MLENLQRVLSGLGSRVWRLDLNEQTPLIFGLGLCAGAAWYMAVWFEPPLAVLMLGAAVALGLTVFVPRRFVVPSLVSAGFACLSGVSLGALAGKLAVYRVSHPIIEQAIGPVMVEGWVEAIEPAKRGHRVRLNVHAIAGLSDADLPRHLRLTHISRLEVDAGRFVRCWAVLRPPPSPIVSGDYAFDRQAYFEGLGAVGFVQGRCRGGTLGKPDAVVQQLSLWVSMQRRQLAQYVHEAAGERAGGFAAALASGDRSFMEPEDQDALRGSGLAHLLAISGLHMGIVGGLIYLMAWRGLALIEPLALRIPVQKPAAALALLASLTYLVLSGATVSTQRAFIMAAVFFGAILFDRVALSFRSLSIAMILVVFLAPWSVLSPGFQMSFAATAALIATYEAWQRRRRALGDVRGTGAGFWIKSIVVTSLVSSLATLPFALYHFDRFATLGLVANVLAMPIVSLFTAPIAGLAMVVAPLGLSEWPLRLFGLSLEGVLEIAHIFAAFSPPDGGNGGAVVPGLSLVFWVLAFLGGVMCKGWRLRFACMAVGGAVGWLVWIGGSGTQVHYAPSGEVFIVAGSGETQRIEIAKGEGLAPLRLSQLPVTRDCSDAVCEVEVEGATLRLIGERAIVAASDCDRSVFTLSGQRSSSCADTQTLIADIEGQNGASWSIRGDRLQPIPKPACGVRPWMACPQRGSD